MFLNGVGDLEDIGEFGLGMPHEMPKPVHKIELSKAKEEEIAKMQVDDGDAFADLDAKDEDDEESKLEVIRLKK